MTHACALPLALLLVAPAVRAAEPAPVVAPLASPATPVPEWYGWQILSADVAVAGTWVAASATDSTPLIALRTLGYLFSAPLSHAAHDRLGTGLGSLGLRVAAPLVGGLVGILIATGPCPSHPAEEVISFSACDAKGGEIGAVAAMLGVSIFDIARAWRQPGEGLWHPSRDRALSWAPVVTPSDTGPRLGLVGRF